MDGEGPRPREKRGWGAGEEKAEVEYLRGQESVEQAGISRTMKCAIFLSFIKR